MPAQLTNEFGKITFTDNAIASAAGLTVMESYGVVGMAATRASDGIIELLKRENASRGVRVTTSGDEVTIDLYIIVEYGISIQTVCNSVLDTVKYSIESLFGIHVANINVHVQGVRV
jgi:uncharacterized alkaline shock family protein YloU